MRKMIKVSVFILAALLSLCLIGWLWLYTSSLPNEEEAAASWSSDGQHLAFECYLTGPTASIAENTKQHYTEEAADICTIDIANRQRVHLVKDPGADLHPVWSPNGTQIAYSRRDGIYLINADGSNQRQLVSIPNQGYERPITRVAWSPDGSRLLFSACLEETPKNDIYLVDITSGDLINLTAKSDLQNIEPAWTLNGTKIIFSSTASTLMPYSCFLNDDAPLQLKIFNIDGSNERIIFDEGVRYLSTSVSNSGEFAFISDLVSKTLSEAYTNSKDSNLYTISLDDKEPVERVKRVAGPVSWSPNGKYLIYNSHNFLEIETSVTKQLPSINPIIDGIETIRYVINNIDGWSSDSQYIAVTVSHNDTGFYSERHIYILNLQDGTVHPLIQK